jgi:hypothetical protein
VTRAHRAEEARQRAEEKIELERSGELRRQELLQEAECLQKNLQSLSQKLTRIGENTSILVNALIQLPQTIEALERWIAEAKILVEAVSISFQDLRVSWEKQRILHAEEEKRERLEFEKRQLAFVKQTLVLVRDGKKLWSADVDSALDEAIFLNEKPNTVTKREMSELRQAIREATMREQREDDLSNQYDLDRHPLFQRSLSAEEREELRNKNSKYECSRKKRCLFRKTHRHGVDSDMRSNWRRDSRLCFMK